jgi:hypothetical protein
MKVASLVATAALLLITVACADEPDDQPTVTASPSETNQSSPSPSETAMETPSDAPPRADEGHRHDRDRP